MDEQLLPVFFSKAALKWYIYTSGFALRLNY